MISGKNMEHIDTSTKIKCLIEMAIKSEMSWLSLDPVIDKLTPTLEKSRQIVKILLKEFETHQSICTLNIQRSNYEEVGFEFTEEKLVSEEIMKIRSEEVINAERDQDFTSEAHYNSDGEISEANFEVFDENDVSKGIQLVEAFKGQLYTFVGDDSEEKFETQCHNESLDHHAKSNGYKEDHEVYTKESKYMARRTSYECKTCGKFFKKKTHLIGHVRTHPGEKPFKCSKCEHRFVLAKSLKIHERIHTGEKPFQCHTCKKIFVRAYGLKIHEMTHTGEKPYQCKACNKCFVTSSHLIRHERTHTGEKPFQCKTCKKDFTQSNQLKKHEKTHM